MTVTERLGRLLGEFVDDPVDELVEMWRWHNGQDSQTQQPLFSGFTFRRLVGEDIRTFRDFASLSWGATPGGCREAGRRRCAPHGVGLRR